MSSTPTLDISGQMPSWEEEKKKAHRHPRLHLRIHARQITFLYTHLDELFVWLIACLCAELTYKTRSKVITNGDGGKKRSHDSMSERRLTGE